jgi:triacylglycerol esterase/lipase EstA (alpha/beta hydrolase family)
MTAFGCPEHEALTRAPAITSVVLTSNVNNGRQVTSKKSSKNPNHSILFLNNVEQVWAKNFR